MSGWHSTCTRKLPSISKEKILIVEDDDAISELLKAILSRYGAVDVAENGVAGLDRISAGYYDVILSDIEMPMMDGIELFKKAVEIFPEAAKNFIFLSGNPSNSILEFVQKNSLHFLSKPTKLEDITAKVREVLDNPPTNTVKHTAQSRQ